MDHRGHPAPRARDLRARLIHGTLALLCAAITSAQAHDPTPSPRPSSKKGLRVQMVDAALALGIWHAGIHVVLGPPLEPDGDDAIALSVVAPSSLSAK